MRFNKASSCIYWSGGVVELIFIIRDPFGENFTFMKALMGYCSVKEEVGYDAGIDGEDGGEKVLSANMFSGLVGL